MKSRNIEKVSNVRAKADDIVEDIGKKSLVGILSSRQGAKHGNYDQH